MKSRQPQGAARDWKHTIESIRIENQHLSSSANRFFVKQQTQWREIRDGPRNRELCLWAKPPSADFLHRSIDIGAVLGVNFADEVLPSLYSAHSYFERAAPSRVMLQELGLNVLNCGPSGGKSLPQVRSHGHRVEDLRKSRDARIGDDV